MKVNTNVASIFGQHALGRSNSALNTNFERLSTGLRINRAADDAAGLGVSEALRAEVRGMQQAMRNTNDGISIIQTAEGSLNEVQSIIQRLRELAVQAASDTLDTGERSYIETEKNQLVAEIDRLASTTSFNGVSLLTTASNSNIEVQVGANNSANDRITINLDSALASDLGIDTGTLDFTSAAGARSGLDLLDTALASVSADRASLGAVQNRLQSAYQALANAVENLSSAESQIRDADIAHETAEMSRNQVLQQAGVSVLAQANQAPQAMLKLLG